MTTKEYNQKYYQDNKEKLKADSRAYYKAITGPKEMQQRHELKPELARYAELRSKGICVCCAKAPATTSVHGGNGGKTIKYCQACRQVVLDGRNESRAQLKIEVLSHYGHGKLQCCWEDCEVCDPDMLTIDHIDNSGAEDRRKGQQYGGTQFYSILKNSGYPEGFQTLCQNHQWKKEMLRRRAARS